MLSDIWGSVSDFLGDGLSSLLESILHATIFKLCYYIERALCWLIGILMDLFEVFAGLEPVTYNGQQQYLINVFFSNKAINNIYWAMAILGMILVFVFTVWAVIRKMFDLSAKRQESLGQIIWGGVRSIFLIVGLTLIMNVVLSATGILMQQIDYIFNNAYHLDQPQEREFSEEEYATMGRVLATIGNYAMVPNSSNRYNLNACFNAVRGDLYTLQQQGIFEYSYYDEDEYGNEVQSWQSVLAQIAKSTDLQRDVMIDVYNEGVASSITAAMDYLRTTDNPRPLRVGKSEYIVTERAHLDRMIFLMGTMRAAKNSAFNVNPAFDDALRGPYYYEDGRSIYSFSNVNKDFNIGFDTDYILVWLAAIAIIIDLVVVILNCIARLFNMLFLYLIAPPVIAVSPLDGGGKFKQWTTAFLVQSLSVFGTVIAMRLLLIYLPIVCSPQLVLFDKPLLNAIGKFMLAYGGVEAAKKSTALLTGILADSAGWQSVQAGDMSSSAGKMVGRAGAIIGGAAAKAGGAALGVASFAAKPVTNTVKQPFKNAAEKWSKLGTGGAQARAERSVKDEVARGKAAESHLQKHPEDAKYLGGRGGGGGGGGAQPAPPQPAPQPAPQQAPAQPGGGDRGGGAQPAPQKQPPPLPQRPAGGGRASDAESAPKPSTDSYRAQRGFERPAQGGQAPKSKDDFSAPSSGGRPRL